MFSPSIERGGWLVENEHLGITQTWMALLVANRRRPSPSLAIAIEDATGGLVTRQELRSDLFT